MPKKGKKSQLSSMHQQLREIRREIAPFPTASPARYDPSPIAVSGSFPVRRRLKFSTSEFLTAATIFSNIGNIPFKILKVQIWATPAAGGSIVPTCTASLSKSVCTTLTADLTYTDVAPASRLAGVKFNVPDTIAAVINGGTTSLVSGANIAGVVYQIEITVTYHI